MSEITDYGELDGYTIAEIFGNEMIYNVLIKYYNRDAVHVEVYRHPNAETKKQRVEVYFDGKLVLDEYYSQYHSCDMFYCLNDLETKMEESADLCNDCGKLYDYCTCPCACVDCGKVNSQGKCECEE